MDIEPLHERNISAKSQLHQISDDPLGTGNTTSATAASSATIAVSEAKLNESNEPENTQCQSAIKPSFHRFDIFNLTDYVSHISSKIASDIANICIIGRQDKSVVHPRDREKRGT